jgi:hypothetical protein
MVSNSYASTGAEANVGKLVGGVAGGCHYRDKRKPVRIEQEEEEEGQGSPGRTRGAEQSRAERVTRRRETIARGASRSRVSERQGLIRVEWWRFKIGFSLARRFTGRAPKIPRSVKGKGVIRPTHPKQGQSPFLPPSLSLLLHRALHACMDG